MGSPQAMQPPPQDVDPPQRLEPGRPQGALAQQGPGVPHAARRTEDDGRDGAGEWEVGGVQGGWPAAVVREVA